MKDAPHADHADHADSPENWRDARLAQALRHMPDAQAKPGARTRHAVLQHAQNAVAGTPAKRGMVDAVRRWWRDWWGSAASGTRWSVALASLAVFGFMVILWQAQMGDMGGGVEDAGRDRVHSATRREVAETAVVAGAPAPAPTPAPESARAAAGPPAAASVLAQSKTARTHTPTPAAPPAAAPPPTLAKEPAADALPAAPARSEAMADAKLEQRARADAAAPLVVHVLSGKRQSRLSLEQSGELLAQLRALRYGPAPSLAAAVGMAAQEGMVVEVEGQERWVIAPDHVERHARVAKDSDAAMNRSAITPEQYAQLLRLVDALLSR